MTLAKEDIPKSLVTSKKIIEHKPHTTRKDDQSSELKKSSGTKVLVDIATTLATPREDKSRDVEKEVRVLACFLHVLDFSLSTTLKYEQECFIRIQKFEPKASFLNLIKHKLREYFNWFKKPSSCELIDKAIFKISLV